MEQLPATRPIDAWDGERWYPVTNTRGEIFHCLSVTTALTAYPKGRWFEDWLKKQGPNADTIRDDAALIGVQVDRGTQQLDRGITLLRDEHRTDVFKARCRTRRTGRTINRGSSPSTKRSRPSMT